MQILLANAKTMNNASSTAPLSHPLFQSTANAIAAEMAQKDIPQMAQMLGCSSKIAAENWKRYQDFHIAKPMPAIMAYNGQAYKHLKADTLDTPSLKFAQKHLWITCFLYGMLRPMDAIVPYRMEHSISLDVTDNKPLNQFWKDKLTDLLIQSVKDDDGILLHLSTEEYEHLFDWNRVKKEVKVIQPLFYVRKGDSLRMQAVWAKSCRGAMTRYILENKINTAKAIISFEYMGFKFNPRIKDSLFPNFIREE